MHEGTGRERGRRGGAATLAAFMAAMLLSVAVPAAAEEVMVRKVDNVFFVAEASGSMDSEFGQTDMSALELSAQLMGQMAARLPDISYRTAIYQFDGFSEPRGPLPHDQDAFVRALGMLGERGRRSSNPIGDGLFELAWPLSQVTGPTALIFFTDGGFDDQMESLPVARQLYDQFDICLHVVSFAEGEEEQAAVAALGQVNPCSIITPAQELLDDPMILEQLVRDISWGLRTVHRSMPDPEVEPVPEQVFETLEMELKVEFEFDKSEIRPEYHAPLDELAQVLLERPRAEVLIVGHTDDRGSYEYNLGLSQRRADAMKAYLVERHAIGAERIETVGYSTAKPVAPNDTVEGRQRNRRAMAHITDWRADGEGGDLPPLLMPSSPAQPRGMAEPMGEPMNEVMDDDPEAP